MVAILSLPGTAAAGSFAPQLNAAGQSLVLNGEGPRKKAFLTIYDTALYLAAASSDAAQIVKADAPMAVELKIVSRFATTHKMIKAMREGFEKSTDGNIAPIQGQIDVMMAGVKEQGVSPDDVFLNVYVPGKGVVIYKNGRELAVLEGLAFKQALFGIWLSDNPIQEKLKKQLLGQ